MACSDFNLSRIRETFGLVVEEPKSLFPIVKQFYYSNPKRVCPEGAHSLRIAIDGAYLCFSDGLGSD
jgi:hypothetical protein